MPALPQEVRQINGLVPIIERKKADQPYVVDGKNFFVDLNGPVSGLSRAWVFHRQIDEPRGWQTLRDGADTSVFHFTGDAIASYDADTRQLYPVYAHSTRSEYWPWTRAVVGNVTYYANKEIGVLRFDHVAGTWKDISGNANLPTGPLAICESGGRLVVLGETAIAWSAIDDGEDLAPSSSTGAGFQLLSLLSSSSNPMMVLPYANGFLTFTKAGILRSELVDAANPYRHRAFSRRHTILNPWCVTRVGTNDIERIIMLTPNGLFSTTGAEQPTEWQPLMSEFFNQKLIPNIPTDGRADMTFRLDTDTKTGWFLVSVSIDGRNSFYSRAYVHYLPSEQWGIYSRVHHGFGQIHLNSGANAGFFYGVVDVEGTVWQFSFTDADLAYPSSPGLWLVDFRKPFDLPVRNFASLSSSVPAIMSTMARFSTDDLRQITEAGVYDLRAVQVQRFSPATMPDMSADETPSEPGTPLGGTYLMRSAIGTQATLLRSAVNPISGDQAPLDAEILVGPFRFPEETTIDHVAQLTEAVIGMLETGIDDEIEDYLEDFSDEVFEDWNVLDATEDWGAAAGDNTEYTARWVGTLDAYRTWIANGVTQDIMPDIVAQDGRVRHFAGTCSGAYILLKFTANNVGETFHLRLIKTNFINAGQLF